MPAFFLDSSALVKGYRNEAGTRRVSDLLRGADPLLIAQLAHLEVSSAIVRRAHESQASAATVQQSLDELDREVTSSLEVIRINDALMYNAILLTRTHRLRAADAMQLAAALIARDRVEGQELIFVSADEELNAAAMAEGLRVENPSLQP
jgi:predicted nucleic acid-binding protein